MSYILSIGPKGAPDLYRFATKEPIMPSDVTPELLAAIQEYVRAFQDSHIVRKDWRMAHIDMLEEFEPFGGIAKRNRTEREANPEVIDHFYPLGFRSKAAGVYFSHMVANYLKQATDKYIGDIFDEITRINLADDFRMLNARTGLELQFAIQCFGFVVDPVSKNRIQTPYTIVIDGGRTRPDFRTFVRADECLRVIETDFRPVEGMYQEFDWITDYFTLYNY